VDPQDGPSKKDLEGKKKTEHKRAGKGLTENLSLKHTYLQRKLRKVSKDGEIDGRAGDSHGKKSMELQSLLHEKKGRYQQEDPGATGHQNVFRYTPSQIRRSGGSLETPRGRVVGEGRFRGGLKKAGPEERICATESNTNEWVAPGGGITRVVKEERERMRSGHARGKPKKIGLRKKKIR